MPLQHGKNFARSANQQVYTVKVALISCNEGVGTDPQSSRGLNGSYVVTWLVSSDEP